jgi:CubicO group peptidase (beta-lactamase class C family)
MRIEILSLVLSSMIASAPAYADQEKQNTSAQSRADAVLAEHKKAGAPGCAVGVYQNGNTLYEGAYGLANLEHSVPIDPQLTVFNIASVSKQFTAASILLLVQDGKLKLDDDIRKYLPEIPDYGHTITINHLLHHTSGVRDYTELWWMSGKSYWDYADEQEALTLISNQSALNFTPGSNYAYSNSGYFLLSVIVQRVSGKSLAAFAQERIFSPLGMKQTYYKETLGRVIRHIASGYSPESEGVYQARLSGWTPNGDTHVHTTVADLAKWQRNFDEPKVGGAWLIQQLEQRAVLNDGKQIPYARGLEVYDNEYRGVRAVMHNGGTWDGFKSDLVRFSSEKLSIAVLCNSHDATVEKLRDQLAEIYMEGKFQTPTQDTAADQKPETAPKGLVPISKDHLKLLGVYWNREDITVRRIERSGGKWWYVRNAQSRSELMPIENGKLQMLGVPTPVVIESMPSEDGLQRVQLVSQSPAVLEEVQPASSDAKALNDFAGVYTHPDLDGLQWSFEVKDGKLTLPPPPAEIGALNPVFKDAFLDGDSQVLFVFQRDVSGRVTSVLVDTARVRNMVFTKQ